MPATHDAFGMRILYPENWTLQDDQEAQAFTLESPSGAFMTLSRLASVDESKAAMEQAQKAMESEYDEVEQVAAARQIAGLEFTGITQRFVFLDLIITSHLLHFANDAGSFLVQLQAEDREMDEILPVFEAMLTSACLSLSTPVIDDV